MSKKLILLIAFISLVGFANAQWQQTTCPYSGEVYCFATKGDTIFAGSGGGVSISSNNGNNWTTVNTGLYYGDGVLALAIKGSDIFAGTLGYGAYISSNNGSSWDTINNGLPPTLGDLSVNALAINGNYIFAGNIAAASYYGVFISSNNGSNWDTTGLIDINNGVQTLATKGDTIFAGVFSDGGVYVSLNNGISWKQADSGLPSNTDVMTFAISGNNIFAGTQGNGVYLSSNNGKLWTAVNNGLTNNEIMSIVLNGNNIFAGTDGGGVFLSTNNGSNWTAINNGLPTNTFARALAINGNYLFAGTSDGGVWRFPLSALGIKEINNNADNIAVYPNPVTNTLTIDIPQAAGGNISIYNLLGEEVYSTTNNKPQTTNNIDVSAFPGGMYIVEVKTDKGVSENKFIKE